MYHNIKYFEWICRQTALIYTRRCIIRRKALYSLLFITIFLNYISRQNSHPSLRSYFVCKILIQTVLPSLKTCWIDSLGSLHQLIRVIGNMCICLHYSQVKLTLTHLFIYLSTIFWVQVIGKSKSLSPRYCELRRQESVSVTIRLEFSWWCCGLQES